MSDDYSTFAISSQLPELVNLTLAPNTGFGGGDGAVETTISQFSDELANGLAVQSDGKFLVLATRQYGESYGQGSLPNQELVVVRYNADGSLDTSFALDGSANLAGFFINGIENPIGGMGSSQGPGHLITLQPDGKVIVAGNTAAGSLAVFRLNTNGSVDSSFGQQGSVSISDSWPYNLPSVESLTVQADGKIIIGSQSAFRDNGFSVVRLNTNGSLDTSFDGDGVASINNLPGAYSAIDLQVQANGKIVALADSFYGNIQLARFNTDGSLDTSFSGDGVSDTKLADFGRFANVLALQGDGKILVAGAATRNGFSGGTTLLARYNADGTLDSSFGTGGLATTDITYHTESIQQIRVLGDGKILVAGQGLDTGRLTPFVLRYNPDGSLDTSFDGDGKFISADHTSAEAIKDMA